MANVTYIGYHGTPTDKAEQILLKYEFNKSNNEDDWLGSGIYFYDTLENAICYNIRKYYNKNSKVPKFEQLVKNYKILKTCIKCDEKEIVDFNTFEQLYKFLWAWAQIYEIVKDDDEYKKLKFKDGYILNWLINESDYFNGCKVFLNIFNLDLTYHKKVKSIYNKKTRIGGYCFHQLYICVLDKKCISNIELVSDEYEKEFDMINDITNNLLLEG